MFDLQSVEDYLQKKIFPELERGRPGFDKPHTQAVVKKLKEILANTPKLKVDAVVLTIAAYAHDWGYADLFTDGEPAEIQEVEDAKAAHMEVGSNKLRGLLGDSLFDFLSESQKRRAVHLVNIHDRLDDLKDTDELILMEADTLGALDVSLVKPTYSRDSNEKWLKRVRKERLPRFITDHSKEEARRLIKLRQKYYEANPNLDT